MASSSEVFKCPQINAVNHSVASAQEMLISPATSDGIEIPVEIWHICWVIVHNVDKFMPMTEKPSLFQVISWTFCGR